ncbi:uncharacterized protein LOC111911201 [Lactuca sativa]|uniref:uncharacterized protein LOC111911201 n=1 Tax=Lactuca sativa TaxID=4236 RepID=UPI000CD924F7|nr:uncharacterized protein LOC111911201 [Lactuca sativa]
MLFKVDFEKAYDSLSWEYLLEIMSIMGFGSKWCGWIKELLTTTRASILVNGFLTDEFQMHWWLRQGDPLSPFIFILAMEDDVMLVSSWNPEIVERLIRILRCFYLASGLKINLAKRKLIGLGVPYSQVLEEAANIGCATSNLLFLHLGIPVGQNLTRISAWARVIDRFRSKLSKWKTKSLSIGGRLTLVKSVLGSLESYMMSIFLTPLSVLK